MFFHLRFRIVVSLAVMVLVTLYDSFLSLGAPGMNCEGCYIPLALPPSQSNLALRLHNAEGELLTDRSSFPPTGVSRTPHPTLASLVAVYSCAHMSRDIKTGNFRSELTLQIEKPKNVFPLALIWLP